MRLFVSVAVVVATACVRPPPPFVVEPELPSTEEANWLERVTSLRTALGRAGISVEMRGVHTRLESADCATGSRRRCVQCALVGERDRVSDSALGELVAAFARYPVAFLDAAKISRVALCKTLHNNSNQPGGLADTKDRVLYVNLDYLLKRSRTGYPVEWLAQTGHHEIYHLFDLQDGRDRDDLEWDLLNPRGFAYGAHRGDGRPFGCVNAYAATNAVEDRASTFEYMMARGDELCAIAKEDPTVAAKARLVWRRVAAVADVGFLRAAMSCAAELDAGPS